MILAGAVRFGHKKLHVRDFNDGGDNLIAQFLGDGDWARVKKLQIRSLRLSESEQQFIDENIPKPIGGEHSKRKLQSIVSNVWSELEIINIKISVPLN